MLRKSLTTDPILIIEDDPDDQYLMERILRRLNVNSELIFFSNGKEALDHLLTTEKRTFLIFCDINLPLMNGLELRARICGDEFLRRKSIPFVFISTAANHADVALAYEMTVQGFFQKENTIEEMEDTMQTIIGYWSKCKHPNRWAVKT